ncbi:MAG: ArsA family ATPase [Bdellovibrio sp.]|nr:MAG: ArsA family ATPase [Bdellovibrio sp.]
MDKLIEQHKILICVGSGGVGKTTFSASLALRSAQKGYKTLVLTIDPSKRLATSLGLSLDKPEVVEVPKTGGKLFASTLHSEKIFEEFIKSVSKNPLKAQKLLNNRLYRLMATSLSGSQEFTSMEMLMSIIAKREFDKVILDTPPAQHAKDFLQAPENFSNLFQESVIKWFIRSYDNMGLVKKIFKKSTHLALKVLQRLTGSEFMEELSDFFEGLSDIREALLEESQKVMCLLREPTTGFVLVTGFDASKLWDALSFSSQIKKQGFGLRYVILNRAFPQWKNGELKLEDFGGEKWLFDLYVRFDRFYQKRKEVYLDFVKKVDVPYILVPEMNKDIYGLEDLKKIWDKVQTLIDKGEGAENA